MSRFLAWSDRPSSRRADGRSGPHSAFDPHYGRSVPVAPGVRRVTAPNAGPFTFAGTNSYIVGSGRVAIIDPGPDDEFPLSRAHVGHDRRDDHAHLRHPCPSRPLRRRGAAGRGDRRANLRRRAPRTPRRTTCGRLDAGTTRTSSPTCALADGALIAGDGWRMEAIATPGHARIISPLRSPAAASSSPAITSWPGRPPWWRRRTGRWPTTWPRSTGCWRAPEDTYLPGHGGPVTEAHDHVRALKAHRRGARRRFSHCLADGTAPIPAIVAAIYPGPRSGAARRPPACRCSPIWKT